MVGPSDIPDAGRFAIATDPQGAVFAVFQRK
jgi:predicted enzyme related to lactoylglutathione lyase